MIHMRNVQRQELVAQLIKKMAPPLGESLLTAQITHS
jgi:hypothetical protein